MDGAPARTTDQWSESSRALPYGLRLLELYGYALCNIIASVTIWDV